MDIAVLIGRILFAAVFVGSAMGHLTQADQMGGYAESKGIRPGKPIVLLTGVQMLVGGLMVAVGVYADIGALLLALFVIPTAFLMHPFWKEAPEDQMAEQPHFLKDLSLGGAAIALFGFFAGNPDLGLMVTGPLISL